MGLEKVLKRQELLVKILVDERTKPYEYLRTKDYTAYCLKRLELRDEVWRDVYKLEKESEEN